MNLAVSYSLFLCTVEMTIKLRAVGVTNWRNRMKKRTGSVTKLVTWASHIIAKPSKGNTASLRAEIEYKALSDISQSPGFIEANLFPSTNIFNIFTVLPA